MHQSCWQWQPDKKRFQQLGPSPNYANECNRKHRQTRSWHTDNVLYLTSPALPYDSKSLQKCWMQCSRTSSGLECVQRGMRWQSAATQLLCMVAIGTCAHCNIVVLTFHKSHCTSLRKVPVAESDPLKETNLGQHNRFVSLIRHEENNNGHDQQFLFSNRSITGFSASQKILLHITRVLCRSILELKAFENQHMFHLHHWRSRH